MGSLSAPDLRALAERFDLPRRVFEVRPYGSGLINDTFLVRTETGGKAILQRINAAVFPAPERVQSNLRQVLEHAERKANGTDARRRLPRIIPSRDGADGVVRDGEYWRMSSFVERSRSIDVITDERQAREVGVALGRFHALVSDLAPGLLHDTLPGYHETPGYFERFDRVRQEQSAAARDAEVRIGLEFVERRRAGAAVLEDARERGLLQTRVIHGDPKLDNVLFDADTGAALSLIDLDTVKPGLIHYDLGDCVRSCCNRSGESAPNGGEVGFDLELCRAVLEGYFSEAGGASTEQDLALLYDAIRLIPLELGLRFLTDHLQGNVYFRASEPDQNLRRASVQFRLVECIERRQGAIRAICERAHREYRRNERV